MLWCWHAFCPSREQRRRRSCCCCCGCCLLSVVRASDQASVVVLSVADVLHRATQQVVACSMCELQFEYCRVGRAPPAAASTQTVEESNFLFSFVFRLFSAWNARLLLFVPFQSAVL